MASITFKSLLILSLYVAWGTDGTRVASYNPWVSLYWITTGKSIGGTTVMAKENTLDRITALKLMTTGGYTLLKENNKGKIQKGFYADLVILDKDYFSVADEALPAINSLLTIVDGKVVYGTADYESEAPAKVPVIPAWSPVKYYGGYQYK